MLCIHSYTNFMSVTDTRYLTLHASAMMIVCVINLCPPCLMSLWMRIKSPLQCASSRKCERHPHEHGTEIRWNNFCIITHGNRSTHSTPFLPFPLIGYFQGSKNQMIVFQMVRSCQPTHTVRWSSTGPRRRCSWAGGGSRRGTSGSARGPTRKVRTPRES